VSILFPQLPRESNLIQVHGDLENFRFPPLHKRMNTFKKFLETKLHEAAPPAAPPPPGGGGIGGPGALPPAGGAPPMGMPPMGGGMGAPPMGGGMPGAPTGGTAPQKLKAYNVWDVLERVLSGDGQEQEKPDKQS
jgi:hypothetical protein